MRLRAAAGTPRRSPRRAAAWLWLALLLGLIGLRSLGAVHAVLHAPGWEQHAAAGDAIWHGDHDHQHAAEHADQHHDGQRNSACAALDALAGAELLLAAGLPPLALLPAPAGVAGASPAWLALEPARPRARDPPLPQQA